MPVFLDNFTGSAGALSAHTPDSGTWSNVDSPLQIDGSGHLVVNANTQTVPALARVVPTPGSADQTATVVVTSGLDQYKEITVYLRWDFASSTGYRFRIGGAQVAIDFGTTQASAFSYGTVRTSGTWRVDVSTSGGNVLFVVRYNGSTIWSFTDSYGSQVLTAGHFGIGVADYDNTLLIDSVSFDVANPNLQTGTASQTTATTTQVNLSSSAPTGGSGSYTYRWHRSTVWGFTPDNATALTSYGAHLTYADTTASAGTMYYYVLQTSDGADTVLSGQVAGRLWKAPLVIGFLGDSITGGYAGAGNPLSPPGDRVAVFYREFDGERIFTAVNEGVGGSTTISNSGNNWVPGGSMMNAADADFAAAGVTHVMVCLGTNDALYSDIDAAAYQAGLQTICDHLVGNGYKVIVSYPTGTNPAQTGFTPTMLARLDSYPAAINAVVDNVNVFLGDTQMRSRLLEDPSLWLSQDGVHLYPGTYDILGRFMAGALYRVLNPGGGGTYTAASNVRAGTDRGDGTLGTLAVPSASQVLSGVAVDNTTGNVVLPDTSDVRSGTLYGALSALTGTLTAVLLLISSVSSNFGFGWSKR